MQVVWGLLLRTYTNSDDVCFGYLASGRDIAVRGIEELVGPLINMLVCRLQVPSTNGMAETVRRVQADYVEALKHQNCSLAEMSHALNLSDTSLFNTIMSIQRVHDVPSDDAIQFKSMGGYDPTEVSFRQKSEN